MNKKTINNNLQTVYNFLKEEYNVAYKEYEGEPIILFWHKDSNEGYVYVVRVEENSNLLSFGAVAKDDNNIYPWFERTIWDPIYSREAMLKYAKGNENTIDRRFPDIKAAVEAYRMQE